MDNVYKNYKSKLFNMHTAHFSLFSTSSRARGRLRSIHLSKNNKTDWAERLELFKLDGLQKCWAATVELQPLSCNFYAIR